MAGAEYLLLGPDAGYLAAGPYTPGVDGAALGNYHADADISLNAKSDGATPNAEGKQVVLYGGDGADGLGATLAGASVLLHGGNEGANGLSGEVEIVGRRITLNGGAAGNELPTRQDVADGYEAVGTAADQVATHAAAANPHPVYLTQAEGDALYAPIGGGGGASEIGTTSVGGLTEALLQNRVYLKKLTLAAAGILASVSQHVKMTAGNTVSAMGCAVYSDTAGLFDVLIGAGLMPPQTLFPTHVNPADGTAAARWVTTPLGILLPAGDYWIATMWQSSATMSVYYAAGGSDRIYTSGGYWFADQGLYVDSDSTKNFSIKAALIAA